jgi:hypothetical protein
MANQIGADWEQNHIESITHVRGNEVVWGGYNMRMWSRPNSPLYNERENRNVIGHGRYEEGAESGQFEVGDLIFASKNYQAGGEWSTSTEGGEWTTSTEGGFDRHVYVLVAGGECIFQTTSIEEGAVYLAANFE